MPTKPVRYRLDQSPFYKLRSHRKLAAYLGLELPELRKILAGGVLYKEFDIPKKNGGFRHVENPSRLLKRIQKRIAKILSRVEPPDYLFCPVKGRSYVSNAAYHQDGRVIRCLDVRKYFPNTPARRVYWFFSHIMKCENDLAATMTQLATYKGHLPTGSPLSPIMAFFAYYDVWNAVAVVANRKGLKLSVYIDDVTVSGKKVTGGDIWEIKRVIHSSGLRYHKEKHYVDTPFEITGVIVKNGTLRAPNRQLKKLHDAQVALGGGGDADTVTKLRATVKGLSGQLIQIRNSIA